MNITLTLSVQEVNQILDALSHRPFREVAEMVQKVQQTANAQVAAANEKLAAEAANKKD